MSQSIKIFRDFVRQLLHKCHTSLRIHHPCQFLDTYPPMPMNILRNISKRMCVVSISWHLSKPTQFQSYTLKYWYILLLFMIIRCIKLTKLKQPIVKTLTGWWSPMCQKDDTHDEDLGLILQGLIYISLSFSLAASFE